MRLKIKKTLLHKVGTRCFFTAQEMQFRNPFFGENGVSVCASGGEGVKLLAYIFHEGMDSRPVASLVAAARGREREKEMDFRNARNHGVRQSRDSLIWNFARLKAKLRLSGSKFTSYYHTNLATKM